MSIKNDIDMLLEVIIEKAAKNDAEKMGRKYQEPPFIEFSKEHRIKMRRLLYKEHYKVFFAGASKFAQKAAIILLAFIVTSSVAIFSVQAWRVRFLNFIIEMSNTDTDINFIEDGSKSDAYRSDEITLGYLPEGFKLEKSDTRNGRVYLLFRNNEKELEFSLREVNFTLSIDTENSIVKKLKINENEALYSTNINVNILIWRDEEYSYSLSGNIEEDKLIKIAEHVKK